MADQEQKGKICPNCGPGFKTHDTAQGIVCENCGGTFTFTAGEAKLAGTGRIDRIEKDLDELKSRVAGDHAAGVAGVAGKPPADDEPVEESEIDLAEEYDDDEEDL
jgi:hypothetical protein